MTLVEGISLLSGEPVILAAHPQLPFDHRQQVDDLRRASNFGPPTTADMVTYLTVADEVVSCALTRQWDNRDVLVNELVVSWKCRDGYRQGHPSVGALTLMAALSHDKYAEIEFVRLTSRERSQTFYESLGFEPDPLQRLGFRAPRKRIIERATQRALGN
jgi:hypothetical protein